MFNSFIFRMVHPFLFFCVFIFCSKADAGYQQAKIYFNQAYSDFNTLPKGILEAVSWHQTRIENISVHEIPSCSGMPLILGYMGLVVDGKSYFNSTAAIIAKKLQLSSAS